MQWNRQPLVEALACEAARASIGAVVCMASVDSTLGWSAAAVRAQQHYTVDTSSKARQLGVAAHE